MAKSMRGFTIVELLIVVVIIGILAAIVVVAYNGITTQANNAKTLSAANTWIKAIKLYNAETGNWPVNSCFGSTSTYVGEGGQCWDSSPSWVVSSTFLSTMQPYISGTPEPDTTNLHTSGSAGSPKRGAFFYNASGTDKQVYMMFANTSSCPDASATFVSQAAYGNGVRCLYRINQ